MWGKIKWIFHHHSCELSLNISCSIENSPWLHFPCLATISITLQSCLWFIADGNIIFLWWMYEIFNTLTSGTIDHLICLVVDLFVCDGGYVRHTNKCSSFKYQYCFLVYGCASPAFYWTSDEQGNKSANYRQNFNPLFNATCKSIEINSN